jgi:hypothetical protein
MPDAPPIINPNIKPDNPGANRGQGSLHANQNCDHSCKVSAAIIIPIIFAICVAFMVYCIWGHKYLAKKRAEKRRAKEEKDVEMRKLGDRDEVGSVVGSVSDAGFVQDGSSEGQGSMAGHTHAQAKKSRWWHRS